MFRTLIALLALAAFATTADAQPQLPLSPGVRPGNPIGPGMPAGIGPGTFRGDQAGIIYFPAIAPEGVWTTGWAYQTYSPWTGFRYSFGGYLPLEAPLAPQAVTVEQPRRPDPVIALVNEFPATLSLQFPAAAEVWLNGKKMTGGANEEHVLTSPVLKPGQEYTFDVKARWTSRGKSYETTRSVTLSPGDRSRLLVISGTEVRE